jgi:hypothetical protein
MMDENRVQYQANNKKKTAISKDLEMSLNKVKKMNEFYNITPRQEV